MQNSNSHFSQACYEISHNLLTVLEPTKKDVKAEIRRICAKYSLERIPRNYEILSRVAGSDFLKLKQVFFF